MSFFPDLAPMVQKLDQFSQTQSLHQKEMISLLRTISQQLEQIKQNQNNYAKY
jgi:hypothetical protein